MAITDTVTAQWVKDRFLVGVDLTIDDGSAYPDALYTHSINAAIATVEAELDVVLSGGLNTITGEKHDLNPGTIDAFFLMAVDKRPLREITAVKLQFGGFDGIAIPDSWVHIASSAAGQLQLIAGPDSLMSVFSGVGLPTVYPSGLFLGSYLPLYVHIDYKAGWDGSTYPYPNDILEAIGLTAAILPLDTAGDLIAGAGVASRSVSFDGLSTSLSTTSSATNAGYGAKIISMRKRLEALMTTIKRKYRVPQMSAF